MLPLAEYLEHRGHTVFSRELPRFLLGRIGLLHQARASDVVILQKKLFPTPFVALLARANPNLIFDVDDAVMFHEMERGEPVDGKFFRRFAAIAAASRIVVTGNAYLADFARATRRRDVDAVHILPTPIDTRQLAAKTDYSPQADVVIGWIGTKGNLHQLKPLTSILRNLQAQVAGVHLRIVADRSIDLPGVNVESKVWSAADEANDLRGFDIGIMPLEDSLWNCGKGGYKLLQYMAAGLPAVASPVGINAEIINDGVNGYLASNLDEWRANLLALARSTELRRRIGQSARATVEQHYSLDRYLERYTAVIESCTA